MAGLILIVVAVVFIWFTLVLPQKRRSRATVEMQDSVEVGDEIVTAGGFYGDVQGFDEDDLLVEIAPGVVVRTARRAVAGIVADEEEPESESAEEEPPQEPAQPAD